MVTYLGPYFRNIWWSRFVFAHRHIVSSAGSQPSDEMPNGGTGCKIRKHLKGVRVSSVSHQISKRKVINAEPNHDIKRRLFFCLATSAVTSQ